MTPQSIRTTYLPQLRPEDVRRNASPLIFRVAAIIELIVDRKVSEQTKVTPDDPLLDDGDSPALERYRLAKAKHAELDYAEREKQLIDKEKCRDVLSQWGNVIRKMGDRVSRRFGVEANQIVSEAIDECESVVKGLANADP